MITITPVPHALVPVDSAAAARVTAPNYDEFQSDREIWELLQDQPSSVLRVTMAHCDAASPDDIGRGDSPGALAKATSNMRELEKSPLVEHVRDILWVYEIDDPRRPVRALQSQVGIEVGDAKGLRHQQAIRPATPAANF